MAVIDVYEDKWHRKAVEGFRKNFARMVRRAESFEAFCNGIAAITGLDAGTIAASLPAMEWKKFQSEAERYVDTAVAKIEAAYRAKKWSRKYIAAFGGGGS